MKGADSLGIVDIMTFVFTRILSFHQKLNVQTSKKTMEKVFLYESQATNDAMT